MDVLRSLLFVPANRDRMLERAASAGADALVLDLEDAVALDEKKAARRTARTWIPKLAAAGQRVFVRVNDVHSGLTRDDLMACVRKGLAGVVLPKAEHPQDVRDLDVLLREAEMANRVRPGDVRTVPLIESARGLLRCEDIARASDRIVALSIGGEDYTAELGVRRNPEGTALVHLRYTVVQVAVAYGLLAIDTPYPGVRDARGLAAEARFARAIGFKGKYAVHPGQVAAINRVFTPAAAEVAEARRVIEAADRAAEQGLGAVSVDGRMVDRPVVERARRLLASAEAIRGRAAARRLAREK